MHILTIQWDTCFKKLHSGHTYHYIIPMNVFIYAIMIFMQLKKNNHTPELCV